MKTMALIQNGVVENLASWDGFSEWNPGDQFTLVDVTDKAVDLGWRYVGRVFTNPEI